MNQVNVSEFANMCGVSTTAIRKLITLQPEPKLAAIKDDFGNYILDLDNDKNKNYLNAKTKVSQPNNLRNNQVAQPNLSCDNQETQVPNEVMITLITEIKNLSYQAGKAEQLENNIIEKKEDVKYWQAKYFELQTENNQLHNQVVELSKLNENLEKDNIQLEEKLSQQGKKGFLGIFKR